MLTLLFGSTSSVSNQAKKDIDRQPQSNKVRAEGGLGAGTSYTLEDFEGEALVAASEAFSDPVKYMGSAHNSLWTLPIPISIKSKQSWHTATRRRLRASSVLATEKRTVP